MLTSLRALPISVIVLIIIYASMALTIVYYRSQSKRKDNIILELKDSIALQNSYVSQYKRESKALEDELRNAAKKAQITADLRDKRVNAILKENVPNNCEEVIQYGISKAEELSHG